MGVHGECDVYVDDSQDVVSCDRAAMSMRKTKHAAYWRGDRDRDRDRIWAFGPKLKAPTGP